MPLPSLYAFGGTSKLGLALRILGVAPKVGERAALHKYIFLSFYVYAKNAPRPQWMSVVNWLQTREHLSWPASPRKP